MTIPTGAAPRGLTIAAPASGAGKTTLTLGLIRALVQAGLTVQPFKNGPDYIDPAFHAVAAGRQAFNLDSWAMGEATLSAVAGMAEGADLAIFEGSMGLYDATEGPGLSGHGATSEIARRFGWPVVLVLDVAAQAQSAGAVARGFVQYPDAPPFAGVVLNNLGGARHEVMIRTEMARLGIPVLGALPRRSDLALPERHLGLVQAAEQADLHARLDRMAAFVADHADLNGLILAAKSGPPLGPGRWPDPPAGRIALARDAAFSFAYPHLIEAWRRAGAEILPFSPLADEAPDATADLVWLPGGYPELHAGQIAAAETFLTGLRRHAQAKPVHGECGGYMVLGEALIDADGHSHQMAGLLGLATRFERPQMVLGYRRAELLAPLPGHRIGAQLMGHAFHLSRVLRQTDPPLARLTDAEGNPVPETGSARGLVTGSFFHLISAA